MGDDKQVRNSVHGSVIPFREGHGTNELSCEPSGITYQHLECYVGKKSQPGVLCVLHIKPYFFTSRADSSILSIERGSRYAVTKLRHADTTSLCGKQSRRCRAVSSVIVLNATDTTYTFHERGKTQEQKKRAHILCTSKREQRKRREKSEVSPGNVPPSVLTFWLSFRRV